MSKQTLTDILWDQIKEGDVILKAGGSGLRLLRKEGF